jgi:hypothetical protein
MSELRRDSPKARAEILQAAEVERARQAAAEAQHFMDELETPSLTCATEVRKGCGARQKTTE